MSEHNKHFWIGFSFFAGSMILAIVGLVMVLPAKPSTTKPVQPPQALGGGSQVVVEEKPVIKPLSLGLQLRVNDLKAKLQSGVIDKDNVSEEHLEAILDIYNSISKATGQPPVIHLDGVDFQTALLASLTN